MRWPNDFGVGAAKRPRKTTRVIEYPKEYKTYKTTNPIKRFLDNLRSLFG